jgi:hypothetical protein
MALIKLDVFKDKIIFMCKKKRALETNIRHKFKLNPTNAQELSTKEDTVCPQSPFGVLKNCGAQSN